MDCYKKKRFSANTAERAHAKTQRRKDGSSKPVADKYPGIFYAPLLLCVSSFLPQLPRRTEKTQRDIGKDFGNNEALMVEHSLPECSTKLGTEHDSNLPQQFRFSVSHVAELAVARAGGRSGRLDSARGSVCAPRLSLVPARAAWAGRCRGRLSGDVSLGRAEHPQVSA